MRAQRPEMVLDLGEGGAAAAAAEHVAAPASAEEFLSGEQVISEPAVPIHPAARLLPMMGQADFLRLRQDIAAHGFDPRKPLVFVRDRLLDGRNRLAAALLEGLQLEDLPRDQLPDGVSPVDFVLRDNLHRRHLSRAQLAAVAAAAAPLLSAEAKQRSIEGARRGGQRKPGDEAPPALPRNQRGRAAVQAAEQIGAGHKSTQILASVQKTAPEVVELVRDRKLNVEDARRLAAVEPAARAMMVTAIRGGAAPAKVLPKDLATARRHEDARHGDGVRSGPDLDVHDPSKITDWRAMGAAWVHKIAKEGGKVPTEKEELRRHLAASYVVELNCAKWGAVMAKGQGDRVRDQALHALVEGAMRAAHGPKPARRR